MDLLLDTHILLWAALNSPKLSKDAYNLINSTDNTLFFSTASIWEVAIKNKVGREDFKVDPVILRRGLINNDYREVSITSSHAIATSNLPFIHKDPFDRILLAQAIQEDLHLLTADRVFAQYSGPIHLV